MSVSPPLTNGAGRSKDFGIRLVLTALVLMGGLAAVLVTEARTPHHSGWTAYAPIGNVGYGVGGSASRTVANLAHQEQVNIGRASCVLSWTNGGGIALCTDPSSGLAAGSRHLDGSPSASRASGSRTADLRAPVLQPLVAPGDYIITCVTAGTAQASFSSKGLKGPKGRPNSIAVNTFSSTFGPR